MEGAENEGGSELPATMEEMRRKRLAYFNSSQQENNSGMAYSESQMRGSAQKMIPEAQVLDGRSSTDPVLNKDNNDNHKDPYNREFLGEHSFASLRRAGNRIPENSHPKYKSVPNNDTYSPYPSNTDEGPQFSSKYKYANHPEVVQMFRSYTHTAENLNRLSLGDSYDFYNSFHGHANVDYRDLGLSTHRPESQGDASMRGIDGELFIPTTQGSGKVVQGLFSEKTTEEIHSALGEKGFQDLMMKVSRDMQRERTLARPEEHGHMRGQGEKSSSVDSEDDRQRPVGSEQSPHRRIHHPRSQSPHSGNDTVTKNLQQLKEGEKEVFTLVRNYDQVTVPKNTKNSFSADEIYRQAFGDQSQLPSSMDRHHYGQGPPSSWSQAWQDKPELANPSDNRYNSPRRRFSQDSGHNMQQNMPHFQNQQNPFYFPPPSYPPPNYEPHSSAVPMSPHSTAPPTSPFTSQEGAFSFYRQHPYRFPNNQSPQFYPDANHGYPYHQSYVPSSPSATVPPSPNSYFYPPPTFSGPYGVPKFPNGVPLHLPPPPIPPHLMKQHSYSGQQPIQPHPPNSARRNSLNHSGPSNCQQPWPEAMPNNEHMKVPHPPPVPPALRPNDEGHDYSQHGMEHRRISSGNAAGGEVNSYNLQRYFSSLELYDRNSSDPVPSLPLQSSRSVEGEMSRGNNDDAVSAFTSVSRISSEKAGGVTRRLQDLGVDLDHLKHLRVVDKKYDQEEADADFENLVKGVRYCPECGSSNKAYMNWCTECGELVIGVELSFPGNKNRPSSSEEKKRKPVSAKGRKGRDSVRTLEVKTGKAKQRAGDAIYKDGGHSRKESPESGRGLSLTNSPVRYRRDQEEVVEPKDSGRASSGDVRERGMSLPQEEDDEAEDGEGINIESDGNGEGVDFEENGPDASEPDDFCDQIMDPVLREFIISYRKRESSESVKTENSQHGPVPRSMGAAQLELRHENTASHSLAEEAVELYDEDGAINNDHMSFSQPVRTAQTSTKVKTKEVTKSAPVTKYSQQKDHKTTINTTENVPCRPTSPENEEAKEVSTGKKKKKKKKKVKPMDIEIFGYEETRLSRNSSRASNLNVVPALNLKCSSDEDESDDDEDEDDSDDEDNDNENANVGLDVSTSSDEPTLSQAQAEYPKSFKSQSSKISANRPQSSGDHSYAQNQKRGSSGKPAPQRPLTTTQKSPPQPSRSQSGSGEPRFHQRRCGSAGTSGSYQRHWAKSSIAWSSYNPRELNTRSSLNSSPLQNTRRGGGPSRSMRVSHSATSLTDGASGYDGGGSGIPVKQRPSSAEYSHRRPAAEPRQRPASAKVTSSSRGTLGYEVPQEHASPGSSRSSSATRQSSNSRPTSARRGTSPGAKAKPTSVKGPSSQGDAIQADSMRRAGMDREFDLSARRGGLASSYKGTSLGARAKSTSTTAPTSQGDASSVTAASVRSGEAEKDVESPRLLCAELHRLPLGNVEEGYKDMLHAVAKNAYDKVQEMTPRIEDGELSRWQCMPDEIWLYIFNFLSQADLKHLMLTCQYFYRLANDETLWKYITVKPRCAMTDASLATIAHHHPVSLAMVKCQGNDVTEEGLHYFFKETEGRLRELNICGCSQGHLVGSVILKVAAQYCSQLTHLDASFCSVSDEAFIAISESAERLESVCVNGFQSMSDASLLALIKKHGRSLRTLELYACFSLNACVFRSMGEHCTNLRRLCLGSCNKLTDSAMVTLSTHLARIEELDLRGCKNLRNDCIRKIVRNCPRIQTLVLANCQQISDIALTEIATYLKTTLRLLDVCGCNRVSDQGVISLAKNCDRLISVDISSTRCSSVSVNQLANNSCSRWLETVKLSFLSGLSEACMVNLIRQCPRLKLIHIFGCSSLRNLARLRGLHPSLSIEGDDAPRHLHL